MSDEFKFVLLARPESKSIDEDDWKAMMGSAAWLRMRRNMLTIEPDVDRSSRWVCNSSIVGKHFAKLVRDWMNDNAIDLFRVESYDRYVDLYCLDRRDAVQARMYWHDREEPGV